MTLFPIEHAHRLRSPAEAAAFYRALGEREVRVRRCHTTEPARIARLIEAADPERDSTISFEGGALGDTARAALAALVTQRYGYLDVRTPTAILRIWPGRDAWVYAAGDHAAASAALAIPLADGLTELADGTVTIDARAGYPIDLRTQAIATALRLFLALAGDTVVTGHCTGLPAAMRSPLVAFLVALGTEVSATLALGLDAARALTELYAGESLDWQANMLIADFPEGRIHGYLKTPSTDTRDRATWHARVDQALREAELA